MNLLNERFGSFKGTLKAQHVEYKAGRVGSSCKLQVVRKTEPKTKAEKSEMMNIPYAYVVESLMYAMVCT